MSHKGRRPKQKIPKLSEPIQNKHCSIHEVVEAIYYQIKMGWMREFELDEIYQKVKDKLKQDAANKTENK
jgi:uncharacterized protein (DUF2344 family)